jgi:hypothetical protein
MFEHGKLWLAGPSSAAVCEGREVPAPGVLRHERQNIMSDSLKKFGIAVLAVIVGVILAPKVAKYLPV